MNWVCLTIRAFDRGLHSWNAERMILAASNAHLFYCVSRFCFPLIGFTVNAFVFWYRFCWVLSRNATDILGQEREWGTERRRKTGERIGIGEKEDVIRLCLDLDPGSDVFVCLGFLWIFPFLCWFFNLFSSSRWN